MRAIGEWVLIKINNEVTESGIKHNSMDEGKVISCVTDTSLQGKNVHFDINKVVSKTKDYWVVGYSDIFAVVTSNRN